MLIIGSIVNFLFPLFLLSSTALAEDTALKIKIELRINGTPEKITTKIELVKTFMSLTVTSTQND